MHCEHVFSTNASVHRITVVAHAPAFLSGACDLNYHMLMYVCVHIPYMFLMPMWYVYIYKSPAWHKESLMYEHMVIVNTMQPKHASQLNVSVCFVYKFTIFQYFPCFSVFPLQMLWVLFWLNPPSMLALHVIWFMCMCVCTLKLHAHYEFNICTWSLHTPNPTL